MISETFIWSAWNLGLPIISVFVVSQIPGGNIEIAASAVSFHLIIRVIFEISCGRFLLRANDVKKILTIIVGLSLLSLAHIGFAFANSPLIFYLAYSIAGIGLGIASPSKNSFFSTHLDHNQEAMQWGIYDAVVFTGMAAAAAIGGIIAHQFGFTVLFIMAALVNLLGVVPYYLYLKKYLLNKSLSTLSVAG